MSIERSLVASYAAALLVLAATPVHAYIGPGAGVGTIAVVLGILGSIVLAFFAIIWYPLKRLFKKRPAEPAVEAEADSDSK